MDKKDLITMIDQSSKELHRNIDYYRFLMTSILDEGLDDEQEIKSRHITIEPELIIRQSTKIS